MTRWRSRHVVRARGVGNPQSIAGDVRAELSERQIAGLGAAPGTNNRTLRVVPRRAGLALRPLLSALGLALLAVAGGCASPQGGAPFRGGAVPAPADARRPESPNAVGEIAPAAASPGSLPADPAAYAKRPHLSDPILASPQVDEARIRERMTWWLDLWTHRTGRAMQGALSRMGRYEEFIAAELAERGLPSSLRFLPMTETDYVTTAVSPVGAGGLWQFMPATARWMGLRVDRVVDARFDPFAATPMALDYIVALQEQFGSWFLTLAAYNAGPGRIERAIRAHGGGMPRTDALFVRIRPHLPRETRDFIPKFLAASHFGEQFEGDPRTPPPGRGRTLRVETVQVAEAAAFSALAAAAGVETDEIALLNPHLRMGHTPFGSTTPVRVPVGQAAGFLERLAALPSGGRLVGHVVAEGETLWQIARGYGVSVAELEAVNPRVQAQRLQIGSLLALPFVSSDPEPGEMPAAPSPDGVHVVAEGESLWRIARRYGVSVDALRTLNGMEDARTLIRPGDRIRIPPGG